MRQTPETSRANLRHNNLDYNAHHAGRNNNVPRSCGIPVKSQTLQHVFLGKWVTIFRRLCRSLFAPRGICFLAFLFSTFIILGSTCGGGGEGKVLWLSREASTHQKSKPHDRQSLALQHRSCTFKHGGFAVSLSHSVRLVLLLPEGEPSGCHTQQQFKPRSNPNHTLAGELCGTVPVHPKPRAMLTIAPILRQQLPQLNS